ncbi:MAG: chorismate synthase, partial [Bacteroidales bacterium]
DRRKPGKTEESSPRKEQDKIEFLSGIFEGKTTGAPLAFMIRNRDFKSGDYDHLKESYRPSHADFTYEAKYGIRDHRGGGRSSARETAVRVAGGAIAKLFLRKTGIEILAYVSQIGKIKANVNVEEIRFETIEHSALRCPDKEASNKMKFLLEELKKEGDTTGGIVTCLVKNVPAGLGEPVYDKLEAELAKAILSINAVKGFDIGSGFQSAEMKGSEHSDQFLMENGKVSTKTNFSGGIQGGISNGQDIYFRVAFKPVATLMADQQTINKSGKSITLHGKGRHDVCVVPRAVPIVEAMTALVLADAWLQNRCAKFN